MVAAHQINFSTPRKSTNEYKFTHRIASVHTYRGDCKHSVAQTVGDALASIYTFVEPHEGRIYCKREEIA